MEKGIGTEFMEKTKYQYATPSDQRKGLTQPPIQLEFVGETIHLPSYNILSIEKTSLQTAIEERTSIREYSQTSLSLEELSWLLWTTQGVKNITHNITFRNVPSAGARHAFETFLLVNNIESLQPGLYRYLALKHVLGLITTNHSQLSSKIHQACLNQSQVIESAVTFFWIADIYRMTYRYGQRGYRYIHLDAGHVCQNLSLASEAIASAICPIAAFEDDLLNKLFEIDGINQFVVYLASVGKK